MKIELLKSKIKNIVITESHIDSECIIRLPENLMNEANITEYEKVFIVNQNFGKSGKTTFAFVEKSKDDGITTPVSIAGPREKITIMSIGTAISGDEIPQPIIIDYDSTDS